MSVAVMGSILNIRRIYKLVPYGSGIKAYSSKDPTGTVRLFGRWDETETQAETEPQLQTFTIWMILSVQSWDPSP